MLSPSGLLGHNYYVYAYARCGLYTHHLSSELIKAVKPHVLLRASIKWYMHYIAAANMLNHAGRLKCVNCIKM